ncbi:zinc finger FYVE domain-containing protein 16-like isoform X1 [Conger conger]|uniref:zinc finger FYVE domain-containing protein 16-like isoform X1 n=1 Tax=Conger conger TaxID=82655 RepID=UPI002A5A2056|nr:zinc finger FYVE domain-containing protein 16-like isoform X1 [Conger conger]
MDSFFRAAVCELDKLLDDFEQNEEEPGCAAAGVMSCSPASSDPPGRHFVPLSPLDVFPPSAGALETVGVALMNGSEAPGPPQRGVKEAVLQNGGSLNHASGGVPDLAEEAGGRNTEEEEEEEEEDLELGCGAQLDLQGAPLPDAIAILSSGLPRDPPASVVDPAEMDEAGVMDNDGIRLAAEAVPPVFQVQRTFSVDDAVSHLTCRGPVSDPYRGIAKSLSGTLPWVVSLSHVSTAPESPKEARPRPRTVGPKPLPDVPEGFLLERSSVTDLELDAFLKEQCEREGRASEKHADEGFSEMNGDQEGGPVPAEGDEGPESREAGGSGRHGGFDTEPSPTATDDEDSYFSSPSLDPSPCEVLLAGRAVREETLEGPPPSLDPGDGRCHNFGTMRPKQLWFECQSPRTLEARERSEKTHAPPTGELSANHIHAPPPAHEDIPTLPVIGSGHTHQKTYENSSGCDDLSEAPPCSLPSPSHSHCTPDESACPGRERRGRRSLGVKQPSWVPDSQAPSCMHCLQRFTFTRRRHHCRACGKVYCAICCSRKCRLKYLERDARVCLTCYRVIHRERTMSPRGPSPNPSIPSEYCSTVPPLQQDHTSGTLASAPPTVMVPVSVLKHPGNDAFPREQRQVWFADGLLPNGQVADTTRLASGGKRSAAEPSSVTAEPPVAQETLGAQAKDPQGDRPSGGPAEAPGGQGVVDERPPASGPWDYSLLARVAGCVERSSSLLPEEEEGLPPLLFITEEEQGGDVQVQVRPSPSQILRLLEEGGPRPLTFVLNANLLVNVKLVTYCDKKCWCFSSNGLRGVGQQELVLMLQRLPGEGAVPRDIFSLYIRVYQDAQRGRFVEDLGSVTLEGSFLGSGEHGGFLFFCPNHQPLGGLSVPPPPFLCGLLIHRLEVPWAKVFPLRLQLRLGAEYSVYPSPVVSVRSRKAVYRETGHTIMNLLSDLRNFQYSLAMVEGLQVHMEMGNSYILIPKARFTQMLKVVNSSNEHVISVGAGFSPEADSHLVCFQNEDGNYQTQANSMLGRTRTVTGASFVVFNGALKASSGFIAKSSIVEDGLMVQITPDTMEGLRQALREQRDFQILCGRTDSTETRENVNVRWVDRPLLANAGMTSPVDGRSLQEALRLRMEQNAEFQKDGKTIKCTEVFYLPKAPDCPVSAPPSLFCRLQQEIATATCAALCPNLTALKDRGINFLGLRISSDNDMVEYQAGSGGHALPQSYMNHLDGALIPIIHGRTSSIPPQPSDMELLFYITQTV